MTDHQVRTEEKYSKILLANIYKPATLISILLLIFIASCAIFAPLIAPTNPYDLSVVSIMDSRLARGEQMFNLITAS